MNRFHFILLLTPLLFAQCRKDQWNDCFQATGKDVTEVRTLSPFQKISIGENFDIVLTQDSTMPEEVKITCGDKIIGQITTSVKHGTLNIENKNLCNFVRSYNRKILIEIRFRFVDEIEILSVSNLSSRDTLQFGLRTLKLKNFGLGDIDLKLRAGILDVQTLNSGNVILEGFANILTCSIEEVTQLDARKMLSDDVYIDCHSPLDCYVNPRNRLSAKIFNTGNVFYLNEPAVVKELTENKGSGKLLKL